MKNLTKTLKTIILTSVILSLFTTGIVAKDVGYVGDTPYRHMPIDTFVAGFPLEALVLLGLFAYTIGAIYVFKGVLLIKMPKK